MRTSYACFISASDSSAPRAHAHGQACVPARPQDGLPLPLGALSVFHFLDQKLQSLLTSVVHVPQIRLLEGNSTHVPQIHLITERHLFRGPRWAGPEWKRKVTASSLAPRRQGFCGRLCAKMERNICPPKRR